MNNFVFFGINEIHRAIEENRKVKFTYKTHINPSAKNERDRVVSPVSLIWNEGHYYLFATDGKRYRVDRMNDIKFMENEQREGMEDYKRVNLKELSTTLFSAYSGVQERVTLRFVNYFTDVVLDRFGDKVKMNPIDDEHFIITVTIEVNPQFFGWVFGLGKGVKILSPDTVVEKMNQTLSDITEMYQTDTKT